MPRFSPRMVTLVQAAPSLGEMPVTSGGCRARDMVTRGGQEHWISLDLEHKKEWEGVGENITLTASYAKKLK